ncbi:MAG TPA: hypothetical protein VNN80_05980 [Polyangiaceae bacterium]|nr:hypothetical protein [Polyangiaceae bacterium]
MANLELTRHPHAGTSLRTVFTSRRALCSSWLALALALGGCGGADDGVAQSEGDPNREHQPVPPEDVFWVSNTVATRVGLPLSAPGATLNAPALARQLAGYDPGSLLRCELAGQAAFDATIESLGGVTWGYDVVALEDQGKPRFLYGFEYPPYEAPALSTGDASPVEIVLPDVVAVTESAALFHSPTHGLMLVSIADGQPRFECATQLPGKADQFFFHDGHLVVMTQDLRTYRSSLLHFRVTGTELSFVEAVDLGRVGILDSRRFNDKLVFYTDLQLGTRAAQSDVAAPNGLAASPPPPQAAAQHRSLRVFRIGDTLTEEMHDTLIDTSPPEERLVEQVTTETPIDSLVSESHRFGGAMWASDRYFVVTQEIAKTYFEGFATSSYSVCTASHTVEVPYTDCQTEFETRPNPDYVPPDNSGGDRGCQGTTLSDCLVAVARVSNRTIQVPIGQRCEEKVHQDWYCDARENRTTQYPEFRTDLSTRLEIYEYTDAGFVRVENSVHEITTPGLDATSLDAVVPTLGTSSEAFDLAVPGSVQSVYFQNGFLYVISQGVLQVYALGGSSLVRTSTLPVVNDTLQSTLFARDRLYLSDAYFDRSDVSTLRVVNLQNPAFPTVEASSHSLPGGHRSILATDHGIFTIGSVSSFQGNYINTIKLGLFSDPFVDERSYLILATDLGGSYLGTLESQFFDSGAQRALVPYEGRDQEGNPVARVGLSHVEPDQLVSEGAVVVPELPERVRPMGGASDSYLSFARNSIEWLTPLDREWQGTPVLEYFQPIALYRINDQDDYVEVQRIGTRCKLYFANAANINERTADSYSEEFACSAWAQPSAYQNRLLFGDAGIEFDVTEHGIRTLEVEEVLATRELMLDREVCLLGTQLMRDASLDPRQVVHAEAEFTCMGGREYIERRDELIRQSQNP